MLRQIFDTIVNLGETESDSASSPVFSKLKINF